MYRAARVGGNSRQTAEEVNNCDVLERFKNERKLRLRAQNEAVAG